MIFEQENWKWRSYGINRGDERSTAISKMILGAGMVSLKIQ